MSQVNTRLVATEPALTGEQLLSFKGQIDSQTDNIWADGATLGCESQLHKNALKRFNEVNRYTTPVDPELAAEFQNLLFRSWYNVWRSRDFSVQGFQERHYSKTKEISRRAMKLLENFNLDVEGQKFSFLHLPLFDPYTGERREFSLRTDATNLFSASEWRECAQGVILHDEVAGRFYQAISRLPDDAKFAYSYLPEIADSIRVDLDFCWMTQSSGKIRTRDFTNTIAVGECRFTDTCALDEFVNNRFEGSLVLYDATIETKQQTGVFRSYVNGRLTVGKSETSKFSFVVGNAVSELIITERAAAELEIKDSECSVRISAEEKNGTIRAVKLENIVGDTLVTSAPRLEILFLKSCQFENIVIAGGKYLSVEESSLGTVHSSERSALNCSAIEEIKLETSLFHGRVLITSDKPMERIVIRDCEFYSDFGATEFEITHRIEITSPEQPTIFHGTFDLSCLKNYKIGYSDFSRTQFLGPARFSNRMLAGRTSFDLCEFEQMALFHGSELHQDTSFRGTRFNWRETIGHFDVYSDGRAKLLGWYKRRRRELWPDLRRYRRGRLSRIEKLRMRIGCAIRGWTFPLFCPVQFADQPAMRGRNERLGELERAFRTLRQAMEKNKASDQAAIFHQHEMRARHARVGDGSVPRSEKWFGKLYDLSSDYGGSFMKPLMVLLVLLLVCAAIYFAAAPKCGDNHVAIPALITSAVVMLRPLYQLNPTHNSTPSESSEGTCTTINSSSDLISWFVSNHEGWFKLGSTVQSLLAVILIFLVLLAVRRRFQLAG